MAETKSNKSKFRNDKNLYTVKGVRDINIKGTVLNEEVLFEKTITEDDFVDGYGRKLRNKNGTPLRNIDSYKSLVVCNGGKYDIYIKYCIDRKKYLVSCGYDNGKTFSLSFFDSMIQGKNAGYDFIKKHSAGK
jgi:hypothetical protein